MKPILVLVALMALLPQWSVCQQVTPSPSSPTNSTLSIVLKTASYTVTASDYTVLMDSSAGNRTVTLPASPVSGEIHNIKKIATTNTVTVNGNGNTVDGSATFSITSLNQNVTVQFLSSTGWLII